MKLTKRMTMTLPLLLIVLLSGCTSYNAFKRGKELEKAQEFDKAIVAYQRALDIDPNNLSLLPEGDERQGHLQGARQRLRHQRRLRPGGQGRQDLDRAA